MRRLRGVALLVGTLVLCGLVTALFSPSREQVAPPPVEWEIDVPPRAVLREPVRLTVRIANRGTTEIADVGLKLNRGYSNVMTLIQAIPRATIDDATNERRLYFGPLPPGETALYELLLSPQRAGEFSVTARVVAAQRGFEPVALVDETTGRTELTATTVVTDPRPTPRASP